LADSLICTERMWSSELEPLFTRLEQSPLAGFVASGLHTLLPSHQPAAQPQQPPMRPLVMSEPEVRQKLQLDGHSLELINLLAALLQLCLRYPAVLWPAHRPLALLLSFQGFVSSSVALFAYGATSAYIRWRTISPYSAGFESLSSAQSLVAFALYAVCQLLSCIALHSYALRKRSECGQRRVLLRQRHMAERPVHVSYAPHYFGALLLLLGCAAALPLLHSLCTLYMATGHLRPLVGTGAIISHAMQQLMLWIGLACKRRWMFASDGSNGKSSHHSARDSSRNTPAHNPANSVVSDEFKNQLNSQLSQQLQQQFTGQHSLAQSLAAQLQAGHMKPSQSISAASAQMLSNSLAGQSLSNYALLGPQLKSCLKGSTRYHCATTGRRMPAESVESYGRDAYSDSEGLTSVEPKQQRKRSRLPKFSFRDRSRSAVGHNTLPSGFGRRKQKNCNVDAVDFVDANGRRVARNEEPITTHMVRTDSKLEAITDAHFKSTFF
jgi:hypothetical protein